MLKVPLKWPDKINTRYNYSLSKGSNGLLFVNGQAVVTELEYDLRKATRLLY